MPGVLLVSDHHDGPETLPLRASPPSTSVLLLVEYDIVLLVLTLFVTPPSLLLLPIVKAFGFAEGAVVPVPAAVAGWVGRTRSDEASSSISSSRSVHR